MPIKIIESNDSYEMINESNTDNTAKIARARKLVDIALKGELLLDRANLHNINAVYVKGSTAYADMYRRMFNNANRLRIACNRLIDHGDMISFTLRSNGEFRVNWFTEYVKPEIEVFETIPIDNSVQENAFCPNSRMLLVIDHFNLNVDMLTHRLYETKFEHVDNRRFRASEREVNMYLRQMSLRGSIVERKLEALEYKRLNSAVDKVSTQSERAMVIDTIANEF